MIHALYANASAWVCVGGHFSELFDKEQGTQKRDPLSFLIFSLSIKPHAHLIRNSPQISPITIGATSHSISLYADNTLVYVSDVQQIVPFVLKTLEQFGYLSGYKVNLSKSALMLIITNKSKVSLPPQINVTNEVLYFGINVTTSLLSVAKTNYSNLNFKKYIEDINRWRHLQASSHVSLIKMNILSHVNLIS